MYSSSGRATPPSGAGAPIKPIKKVTAPDLRARKGSGQPLAMVTAYDYTMARLLDEAGVDALLVGDSLGTVVQGLANTLPAHARRDRLPRARSRPRRAARAHVVGDLPFMSYQVSPTQAVESAGKLVKEGGVESVKLEAGEDLAEHVWRIVRAGIPVMGHVGLMPQSVHAVGGFKVQGRGAEAAEQVVADARALQDAGVFAIVLEAVPPDVAARVTAEVSVPTIGIGAGASCDGQVLVCTDLLGMSRGHAPKFAKRYAELGDAIVDATARAYVDEVQRRVFPGPERTPTRPKRARGRRAAERGAGGAASTALSPRGRGSPNDQAVTGSSPTRDGRLARRCGRR